MNKHILSSLVLILLSLSMRAQVSAYNFSKFIGTYTTLNVPGSTVVASGYQDDNAYANLPIGFSFLYNNSTYTSVGVSSNGWLTLGSYFPNDNFAPISNSGGNGDGISFLSGDMQMGPYQTCTITSGSNVIAFTNTLSATFFNVGDIVTGNGIPGGTSVSTIGAGSMTISANATASGTSITAPGIISYLCTGTTPTRVFTMQWKRLGRFSNDGTGINDFINAQIKLYETSNVVEIVYGVCGTLNSNTMPTEVGIVGQNNTDFNNINVPLSINWLSSSPGLVNNATAMFSSSNTIPFGLTYRWVPPPQCSGTPAANTAIAGSSLACIGGNVSLNLSNSYSVSGLTYAWQSAGNAAGPYSTLITATTSPYTATNVTANTWYQCIITCTNGGGSYTTAPIAITSVGSITNTTPYFEGFENIQVNNLMPNCSWAASNPTNICQTYTLPTTHNRIPRTGSKFAAFNFGTNATGDYFYTNGIKLYAGITYSAAVHYVTDGANGWSEFSMLVGPSQSTLGLNNIASATGTLVNTNYVPLTNTFTIPGDGIYYLAIKAIGSSSPWYLSWDDLSITAPCNLNTPTLSVNGGTVTQCAGTPVNLSASGAISYTWSTGPNTATVSVAPMVNTTYSVSGSNVVSCVGVATKLVNVDPLPTVTISPVSQSVCLTESATISISGASGYTWNPSNSNASTFTLTPLSSMVFTVNFTGSNNCVSSATTQVTVNACTGLNEQTEDPGQFKIYPNPTNGVFTAVFVVEGTKQIEVTDVTGRIVYSQTTGNASVRINMDNMPTGIYYVKVKTNDQTVITKLIRN